MFATLPGNLAIWPLATFIPLYVLDLGGTLAQVATIVIFNNLCLILASFFWGKISDSIGTRKRVLVTSYAVMTLLLLLLYFEHRLLYIGIIYAAMGVFTASISNYSNLLVIETDVKENWSKNFARLQVVAGIGSIISLVIGTAMAGLAVLNDFILVLAASSAIAVLLAALYIRKDSEINTGRSIRSRINALVVSIIAYPFAFVRAPKLSYLRNGGLSKLISYFFARAGSYIGLFCVSTFFFSISSNLYNADYSAVLHLQGLLVSQVFIVMLVAIVVQTIFFYYVNRLLNRNRFYETTVNTLNIRAFIYILVGLSFFAVGSLFFYSNVLLYALLAGVVYPLYFTSSYSQFFNAIKGKNRGGAIGLYNGVGSIGGLIGSIAAGAIVVWGNFPMLFFVGAVLLLFASYAFRLLPYSKIRRAAAV